MSKTFPEKIDKKFDVSFSSAFFVLSRFWVFLSDVGSKALQKALRKKALQKGRVEQNETDKAIQNRISIEFFFISYQVFGCFCFSVRGFKNTAFFFNGGKNFFCFLPQRSEEPTNHVKARRVFFLMPLAPMHLVSCIPQGASEKKEKENKGQKTQSQKTTDRLSFFFFFFLGASCVGCGPSVDMPPHVGTRSWLRCLPLRASSL
jgi:hypothetical protein